MKEIIEFLKLSFVLAYLVIEEAIEEAIEEEKIYKLNFMAKRVKRVYNPLKAILSKDKFNGKVILNKEIKNKLEVID